MINTNESTNKLIESLQSQISNKDGVIESLKRENNTLIAVIRNFKKKYNDSKLIIFALLLITISIYQFISK